MASQEETMRLVAELLDKTSGPLKDIQKSLRDLTNARMAKPKPQARMQAHMIPSRGERQISKRGGLTQPQQP
jgi:hypothetical protein